MRQPKQLGPVLATLAGALCACSSDDSDGIALARLFATQTSGNGALLRVDPATGRGMRLSGHGYRGSRSSADLAFDPGTGTLFGIDLEENELIAIDTSTGTGTAIALIGPGVVGLAFAPGAGLLYGTRLTANVASELLAIDPATGASVPVGDIGFPSVRALAFDPDQDVLYGIGGLFASREVLRIDPRTGVGTAVGPLGFDLDAGLDFDPDTRTLYCVAGGQLLSVDLVTGAGTPIAPTDSGSGLAFDPVTGTLYGSSGLGTPQGLATIDTLTGQTTSLGEFVPEPASLAFDSLAGILYGASDDELLAVDRFTGRGERIGTMGFGQVQLSYDSATDSLLGCGLDVGFGTVLFTVDRSTGATEAIGPVGSRVTALTFEPATGRLLAYNRDQEELHAIDPTTGSILSSVVSPTIEGLAFDPVTSTLYATDSLARLVTIDPLTGAHTLVRTMAAFEIEGLALDAGAGRFFGFSLFANHLYTFDLASDAGTTIGGLGFDDVHSLAIEPGTGLVYGADTGGVAQLVTIDTLTGAGTFVTRLNGFFVEAMVFHPTTGTLFGTDGPSLFTMEPSTGDLVLIGSTGFLLRGLAFDPFSATLYGADDAADLLVTLDVTSGAGTAIGPLGFPDVDDLAFDPETGRLHGVHRSSGQLLTIDTTTGAATSVGRIGAFVSGLALTRP